MLKKDGYYVFEILSQFPQIVHGITTRALGSVKRTDPQRQERIDAIAKKLAFEPKKLVIGVQVHSGNVLIIDNNTPQDPDNTDGLITAEPGIVLGVVTADCIPVLLYDPEKRIVATVHAGYKGIQNKIVTHAMNMFADLGSDAKNIIAGIGPAIGVCCYNVEKERVEAFQEIFPAYKNFYQEREGRYYLDISQLVKSNLQDAGVSEKKIELSGICTVDHVDEFYSYRKEKDASGRFLSVIGLRK